MSNFTFRRRGFYCGHLRFFFYRWQVIRWCTRNLVRCMTMNQPKDEWSCFCCCLWFLFIFTSTTSDAFSRPTCLKSVLLLSECATARERAWLRRATKVTKIQPARRDGVRVCCVCSMLLVVLISFLCKYMELACCELGLDAVYDVQHGRERRVRVCSHSIAPCFWVEHRRVVLHLFAGWFVCVCSKLRKRLLGRFYLNASEFCRSLFYCAGTVGAP